jgi:hypothetical protein
MKCQYLIALVGKPPTSIVWDVNIAKFDQVHLSLLARNSKRYFLTPG